MIPGVIAAGKRLSPATGGNAADAILYADFVNGSYYLNGVAVTAGDLFNRTDMIVAGQGAFFDWLAVPDDPPAELSASALAAINAVSTSFTAVCEWKEDPSVDGTGFRYPFIIADGPFPWTDVIRIGADNGDVEAALAYAGHNETAYVNIDVGPSATVRAAVRYDAAGFAIAFNGNMGDNIPLALSGVPAFSYGSIGGDSLQGYSFILGYVRTLEIYPSRDDAALVLLSTL